MEEIILIFGGIPVKVVGSNYTLSNFKPDIRGWMLGFDATIGARPTASYYYFSIFDYFEEHRDLASSGYCRIDAFNQYRNKEINLAELRKDGWNNEYWINSFVFEYPKKGETFTFDSIVYNPDHEKYFELAKIESTVQYTGTPTPENPEGIIKYLDEDLNGFIDSVNTLVQIGSPQHFDRTSQVDGKFYLNNFYNRLGDYILTDEQKKELAHYASFTGFLINDIITEAFPKILENEPPNSTIHDLTEDMIAAWSSTQPIMPELDLEAFIEYYAILTSFYNDVQKTDFSQFTQDKKLVYLLKILTPSALSSIPLPLRLQYIKDFINGKLSADLHIYNQDNNIYLTALTFLNTYSFYQTLENIFNINERIILNVIYSIQEEENNEFLDFLLINEAGRSNFERCFHFLDDDRISRYPFAIFSEGETNRFFLCKALIDIWNKSKFNPLFAGENDNIDPVEGVNLNSYFLSVGSEYVEYVATPCIDYFTYQTQDGFKAYVNYNISEEINGVTFNIIRKDSFMGSSYTSSTTMISQSSYKQPVSINYGDYHIFYPINLQGYKDDATVRFQAHDNIPAFAFYYSQEFKRLKNLDIAVSASIEFGIEVALFIVTGGASGVSNIRHIRHLSKVGKVYKGIATVQETQKVYRAYQGVSSLFQTLELPTGVLQAGSEYIASLQELQGNAEDAQFTRDLGKILAVFAIGGGVTSMKLQRHTAVIAKRVKNQLDNGYQHPTNVTHPLTQDEWNDLEDTIRAISDTFDGLRAEFELLLQNVEQGAANRVWIKYSTYTELQKLSFFEDFSLQNKTEFWNAMNSDDIMNNWRNLYEVGVPERNSLEIINNNTLSRSFVDFCSHQNIKTALYTLNANKRRAFLEAFSNLSPSNIIQINDKSYLIDYFLNHTPEALESFANNIDLVFKQIEARTLYLNQQWQELADLYGKPLEDPMTFPSLPGQKWLYDSDFTEEMAQRVSQIINNPNDIPAIANNLGGVPEEVVQVAKENLFSKERFALVELDDGSQAFQVGRFNKSELNIGGQIYESDFIQWESMISGEFDNIIINGEVLGIKKLDAKYLIAHEYVEGKLIDTYGMGYRSFSNYFETEVYSFGAHDIAPLPRFPQPQDPGYYIDMKRINGSPSIPNENLTNLDEIVAWYAEYYKLNEQ